MRGEGNVLIAAYSIESCLGGGRNTSMILNLNDKATYTVVSTAAQKSQRSRKVSGVITLVESDPSSLQVFKHIMRNCLRLNVL